MSASILREARATAFVDELLSGFTTQAVKQKLGEADDSRVMETTGDSSPGVSGKLHELCAPMRSALEEGRESHQTPISASKQASEAPMKPATQRLQPTIQRMAYAKAPEALAKSSDRQIAKELTKDAQHRVSLSESRALSLQTELLCAFTAPAFQKKLHELVRSHKASGVTDAEYHLRFRQLVRTEQIPVIVKYGFKATEEGVIDMLQEMERFKEARGIYVNSEAIKEALFSPSMPAPSLVPQEVKAGDKPESKNEVLQLLRALHEGYSQPEFQAALGDLKLLETDRRCAHGGYYKLSGRADLAKMTQENVLPFYGFEASNEGVCEMISLCAKYLRDPEVAIMFDAINSKLGMTREACQRFRKNLLL
eukprot:TRINITY_DN1588_c0_g3_i2.p1 TRINITY_DN1588_c0_g3~~TRINITY_DN1588_c0_g3_i2.p1  ORF type:complete len:367 (+),score=97.19 TRINITY_DN1588_c0_g3_i2:85-1185(+)